MDLTALLVRVYANAGRMGPVGVGVLSAENASTRWRRWGGFNLLASVAKVERNARRRRPGPGEGGGPALRRRVCCFGSFCAAQMAGGGHRPAFASVAAMATMLRAGKRLKPCGLGVPLIINRAGEVVANYEGATGAASLTAILPMASNVPPSRWGWARLTIWRYSGSMQRVWCQSGSVIPPTATGGNWWCR